MRVVVRIEMYRVEPIAALPVWAHRQTITRHGRGSVEKRCANDVSHDGTHGCKLWNAAAEQAPCMLLSCKSETSRSQPSTIAPKPTHPTAACRFPWCYFLRSTRDPMSGPPPPPRRTVAAASTASGDANDAESAADTTAKPTIPPRRGEAAGGAGGAGAGGAGAGVASSAAGDEDDDGDTYKVGRDCDLHVTFCSSQR